VFGPVANKRRKIHWQRLGIHSAADGGHWRELFAPLNPHDDEATGFLDANNGEPLLTNRLERG
jgi:hypothetical protein